MQSYLISADDCRIALVAVPGPAAATSSTAALFHLNKHKVSRNKSRKEINLNQMCVRHT